jgi:hypothetical protein
MFTDRRRAELKLASDLSARAVETASRFVLLQHLPMSIPDP